MESDAHESVLRLRLVSVAASEKISDHVQDTEREESSERTSINTCDGGSESVGVSYLTPKNDDDERKEEKVEDLTGSETEAAERVGEEDEEESDGESASSEDSLLAASLRRITVAVNGIGERMGQIEGKLEEKMGELGEKISRLETRFNEKVSKLETKFKEKVESTKANIETISHWAWNSLTFDKLPQWLQDNEYLTDHHRPPMNSFSGCFKSMFRMHTETWNIWTHFLGFVFFVVLSLGIYVYGDYITFLFEDIEIYKLPATEQAMLFCFFLAAMICLSCSALFHLLSNHSQTVYKIFSRLDYSGIAILITGSSIPAYYYGFYCSYTARCTHMTVTGILCVACVIVSLWEKFATPEYRPLRFATFVLFGVYGVIPGIHIGLSEGFEKQHVIDAGKGLLVMGSLYIVGAIFYVLRFPERFFPGKFNTWASSHQLFHICVVCAALVHYDTLLCMIKYRMTIDSCALDLTNTLPALELTGL